MVLLKEENKTAKVHLVKSDDVNILRYRGNVGKKSPLKGIKLNLVFVKNNQTAVSYTLNAGADSFSITSAANTGYSVILLSSVNINNGSGTLTINNFTSSCGNCTLVA